MKQLSNTLHFDLVKFLSRLDGIIPGNTISGREMKRKAVVLRKKIERCKNIEHMAYLAVTSKGNEVIYKNKPNRKENSYWSYSGESITLPHGTIRKLTGKDLKFEDEPVESTSDESTTDKLGKEQYK